MLHSQGTCHGAGPGKDAETRRVAQVTWGQSCSNQTKRCGLHPAGVGDRGGCVLQITLRAMNRGDWRHWSPEPRRRSRMLGSWREIIGPACQGEGDGKKALSLKYI